MKVPLREFRSWLVNKNLKEKTVQEYCYYLNNFTPYQKFDQENINKFLSQKQNMNGVSRSFLRNLRKFLVVNYKELGLTMDERIDISDVELPELSGRIKQKLIRPLTQEQILEIEKHIPMEREKISLLMSYYGGLRIGELFKTKISSFNWEEWKKDKSQIGECIVHGKGDKEGVAFFPANLMERIRAYILAGTYPSPSSYIFVNVRSNEKVIAANRRSVWGKALRNAAIKVGIIKFDEDGKIIPETNVTPHKLRHSWGYHLKNVVNMDIRDIQEILRHSSIESTQRYTMVDKTVLKQKLTKNVFCLVEFS